MHNEEQTPFLLKNIYSPAFVAEIAAAFRLQYPAFDEAAFTAAVLDAGWPDRALKQRVRHISDCLRTALPAAYPEAVDIVVLVARHMLCHGGERMSFVWGILPDFIEAYGVDAPDISITALEIVTQISSAEFAVRPFLLRYPERMYPQMRTWAGHSSAMVRRLASEGFRPRLPWGMGVPALKKQPEHIIPVLEILKNDPAETVRRSVANNLNDISKDHPERALQLAGAWAGQNAAVDWVVRHACRGLLKKGNPVALKLFGFESDSAHFIVENLSADAQVKIGDRLHYQFVVKNTASNAENMRLEYAIDYQTLSGKVSVKVFKISEGLVASGQVITVQKNQRFQDFTTRKHYPGTHYLRILVNGTARAVTAFEVVV